jgi:hypothetical protein
LNGRAASADHPSRPGSYPTRPVQTTATRGGKPPRYFVSTPSNILKNTTKHDKTRQFSEIFRPFYLIFAMRDFKDDETHIVRGHPPWSQKAPQSRAPFRVMEIQNPQRAKAHRQKLDIAVLWHLTSHFGTFGSVTRNGRGSNIAILPPHYTSVTCNVLWNP